MSDGTLRFNTKIDNSNVEKDLKDLERKIQKSEDSIAKSENAKLPLVKQMEKLNAELAEAKSNLAYIQSEMAAAQMAMQPGATPEDYLRASQDLPELQKSAAAQEKAVTVLQQKWDSVSMKVEEYDLKIQKATADIAANQAKAANLNGQTGKQSTLMKAGFQKAGEAAKNFGIRLLSVAKSVFIFSALYKILQKVAQYMSMLLKTNKEYQDQMAKLRAALVTAFQPIYEFIVPGLITILRVLTAIVSVVANVLSYLGGKTMEQSAKAAENLNKEADAMNNVGGAAKKASKSLANFDEINTLSIGEKDGGGGGGGIAGGKFDFEEFDTAKYKAKIDELTVYLSGALLAIGSILAFSGANIPLGISMMAVGALGLVTVIKENWGKLSDEVKTRITKVMGIVGGALLALGAIFAFSGVSVGLGIGLMVAGAASLGSAAALNWDTIKKKLEGPLGKVIAIVSGASLAVGAILAFTGVALPLGISLMAVGAASLAGTAALNWDTIKKKLEGPLGKAIKIVSGALLAVGAILAFSGINLPLGISLMATGVAGMVTVGAINWSAILDKMKDVWSKIKNWFNSKVAPKLKLSYWKEKFSWLGSFFDWVQQKLIEPLKSGFEAVFKVFTGLFTGDISFSDVADAMASTLKNMINKMISGLNSMLVSICGKINTMITKLRTFKILGMYPFSDMSTIYPVPQIPLLAKGAVLPPNKPFMAMVGDQKNGTNVEAPLDTIKQALEEVMAVRGGGDITITFAGDLAQLGRVLKPVIDKENSRVGGSLAKGAT